MATKKTYDQALFRLSKILTMLSNNTLPTIQDLANEFGVNIRTIQTDIYKRLNAFPIEKDTYARLRFSKGFSLNKSKLDSKEMVLLSLALSTFKNNEHFNEASESVLQKLIDPNLFNPYYIKQEALERLDDKSSVVQEIKNAIEDENIISIELSTNIVDVEPYKIASYDGFWYLFAKDLHDTKIKTFMISNIKRVSFLNKKYTTDKRQVQHILESTHSAWFNDGELFEVIIEVYPEIAEYFIKREFLHSQEILQEKEDGTLIIKFKISHYEDIDNIIKSWLPHIKVLSPQHFKKKIKQELEEYIQAY